MFPQLPAAVSHLMKDLTSGLIKILDGRLLGVYLGGSSAAGEYCEAVSDLDFLVVTDGSLSLEDALAVELLHKALLSSHPVAARLEGDYAPRRLLIPEGTSEPVPGCDKGIFFPRVGEVMLSAPNIADLRKHGLCLYGPPPDQILPPVTPEQMRAAVREILTNGVGPCTSAAELSAETLNLIRSLYTFRTGEPITKQSAGEWALSTLDTRWHPAIGAAVRIRCGAGTPADEALLREALPAIEEMIKTTLI